MKVCGKTLTIGKQLLSNHYRSNVKGIQVVCPSAMPKYNGYISVLLGSPVNFMLGKTEYRDFTSLSIPCHP
jgi:hypothetical protein